MCIYNYELCIMNYALIWTAKLQNYCNVTKSIF